MNSYFELLRLNEWYKNITIPLGFILAIIISKTNIIPSFILDLIIMILFACMISSSNYVLNAITDKEYDKKHPIKKLRPIPNKKITVKKAYLLMIILAIIPLIISFLIFDTNITITLLALLIAAGIYNINPIRFKNIPYLDVISESINNPIRFLAGWFIITNTFPDIFLLLLVWSSACFLMTRKRLEELLDFKEKAAIYRKVFKSYSINSLKNASIFYISISIIFILYFIL